MRKSNYLWLALPLLAAIVLFSGCGEEPAVEIITSDEKIEDEALQFDPEDYQWSTMDAGPYRDKITYATSSDLVTWEDSGEILAEHSSVPGAVVKDGVIYVYFVDVSENGVPEKIGLITSSDKGQTWSDEQIAKISGTGQKVPVDPDPVLLDDGRIRLYYFDINVDKTPGEPFRIYSAVSDDGLNFREEEGVRFEQDGTLDPSVLADDDVIWYLYTGDIENNQVYVATSSDGLNFVDPQIAYRDSAVPDIFKHGVDYYLYTAGIEISKSTDPLSFPPAQDIFTSSLGMVTADPSVIEVSEGNYLMFYKFSEGTPGGQPVPGNEPPPETAPPPK